MISMATSPFSLVGVAKRIQGSVMEFCPRGLPSSMLAFLNRVQTDVGMDTTAAVGGARDAKRRNALNNPM